MINDDEIAEAEAFEAEMNGSVGGLDGMPSPDPSTRSSSPASVDSEEEPIGCGRRANANAVVGDEEVSRPESRRDGDRRSVDRSRSTSRTSTDDEDSADEAVDPAGAEQEVGFTLQPYFKDLAPMHGFRATEEGFEPLDDFSFNGTDVFVLHGITGSGLKSTYIEAIKRVCEDNDGYDAIYLTDTSNFNNIQHQIIKKWGPESENGAPEHPYILYDLPRGFSSKMSEASFWGTIESLQTAVTSGKYDGGELQWKPGGKPVNLVGTNARPIMDKDSHGNPLDVPVCHLSAHRLMGNVYTMEMGPNGLELVQDVYCDELAIKVREDEEMRHAVMVEQSKSATVLTPKDLFEKYVVSGEKGKFVMDATAPRAAWVEYNTLHLAFKPFAPKIGLKGPGCLSKLMAEWYKDELADGRLVCVNKVRKGDRDGPKVFHFSFRLVTE